MNSEKHIILTILLLFSVVLLLTSTITVYASINNYFKDKYENQYEYKFYRENYNEKIHRQGALCEDPQATIKYGDICKGHGNYLEGVKDECKENGGEWGMINANLKMTKMNQIFKMNYVKIKKT